MALEASWRGESVGMSANGHGYRQGFIYDINNWRLSEVLPDRETVTG